MGCVAFNAMQVFVVVQAGTITQREEEKRTWVAVSGSGFPWWKKPLPVWKWCFPPPLDGREYHRAVHGPMVSFACQ